MRPAAVGRPQGPRIPPQRLVLNDWTQMSPLLVTRRSSAITVRAPDGVGNPVENHPCPDVEQDQMASQEAILDVVGQWGQYRENLPRHGRVRFSVRVDSVDLVGELAWVVV